ncbi:MAG TPA: Lrp/AsnC family transcriptional regulator [Candidatus Nanoarchaeia archaeon]|nr:Lrp/AsnC family transcriptional regulator [Candidatus Nanoarchaeia archaeon]
MLDDIDKKILNELSIDSSRNIEKLAKFLHIPRSTAHNRIKKLEKEGYIKGYRAIIDHEKIGQGLTTFMSIGLTEKAAIQDVLKKLASDPRVEEIHTVTGRADIIVKSRFHSPKEIASFTFNPEGTGMRTASGVSRTETAVVLHTIKEDGKLARTDLFS